MPGIRKSLGAAFAAAAAICVCATPASAAGPLDATASPAGGATCGAIDPCGLPTAITMAAPGETVLLKNAGDFVLTATLDINSVRHPVRPRDGRLLVQQGALRQGGITRRADDLGRVARRRREAQGRGDHPDRARRQGQVAGHVLVGVPGDARGGGRTRSKAAVDEGFDSRTSSRPAPQLKKLVDLKPFQKGFLARRYGRTVRPAMGNGKAAMELMGQWAPAYGGRRRATSKKGSATTSAGSRSRRSTAAAGDPTDAFGGGDGFAVGKDAPPEAVDFLKFLSSVDDGQASGRPATAPPRHQGRRGRPSPIRI